MPKIISFDEYVLYFQSPYDKCRSVGAILRDKYSAYYHIFNPFLFEGKRGDEMVPILETAIVTMKQVYCEPGIYYLSDGFKNMKRWTPQNYVEILKQIYVYATASPTWIFRCEMNV